MLGGERTGAFVPVGNRLATGLTCDASSLKVFVFGRGGDIMLGAVRVLFCLAFYGEPGKGCGSKDREIRLEEGTHKGGGEGERDVGEGGVWLRKNQREGGRKGWAAHTLKLTLTCMRMSVSAKTGVM